MTPLASDFLVLQLGYKEVFGGEASWTAVKSRLDRYSLREVLDTLARISALLDGLEQAGRGPEAQKRLCDGLFGSRRQEVWSAVERATAERPRAWAVILFSRIQFINAAKAALMHLPLD